MEWIGLPQLKHDICQNFYQTGVFWGKNFTEKCVIGIIVNLQHTMWMLWNAKNYTNVYTVFVNVYTVCVHLEFTYMCIINYSLHMLCITVAKDYSHAKIWCIKCDANKNCYLIFGWIAISSCDVFWKFTRLTRILHDRRSHRSRQISTLPQLLTLLSSPLKCSKRLGSHSTQLQFLKDLVFPNKRFDQHYAEQI